MGRRKKSKQQLKSAKRQMIRKRHKKKVCTPDEVYQRGPMRIARYGTVSVFENYATPDQMADFRRRCGERFDQVCEDIRSQVDKCCTIVQAVDPVQLLVRCYWQLFMLSLDAPAEESQQSHDRSEAFRLLEYVQKLICGVGTDASVPEISDAQLAELSAATSEIFRRLQVEYFICRSGRLSERADFDVELDEYAVRTEMVWLGVRGYRYMSQEAGYFRKILSPQSDLLKSVYGITADEISDGVENIISSLSKGVSEVMRDLDAFRNDTLDAIEKDSVLPTMAPQDAMNEVVQKNGWEDRRDSIFGRFFGTDLFEVEKLTGWPMKLIEDLSLFPGQDTNFADGSPESSWPTKFSKTQFAPFLRCRGKSYCFDIHGLTDRLYRSIERGLRQHQSSNSDRWNRRQKQASECLTAELFSRLLPGAQIHIDGHYWTTDRTTGKTTWTDCDLIVVYERQLFVVEVKAGRYTHKPPGRHIRDHLKSLKELIESAAEQANRFLDELESRGELELHDAARNVIATLRHEDFDHATRCCVSLDQIDDIASRSEDLTKLKIDIGPHPVWTLSLNDLLVIADVFTNPLVFIDYLSERLRAFASPTCHVSDELDHLGLYIEHNRYVTRAEKLAPMEMVGWHGYRDVFDRYYSDIWQGSKGTLPTQEKPFWMEQVLNLLAQSGKSGRVKVAEYLLGMDGETRERVGALIETGLARQRQQLRPRPVSSLGDVRLTVWVSQKRSYEIDFDDTCNHTLAVMSIQGEQDRLLLWLQYSEDELLEHVRWENLSTADLDAADATMLAEGVRRLQASRQKLR